MELNIPLNNESRKALYEQVYEYIKDKIKKGDLLRGDKLPSTRSLALNLHLSRQTITIAYEQLEAEGYIKAKRNSGYFVNEDASTYNIYKNEINIEIDEYKEEKEYIYDLSPNGVDFSLFPFSIWRKLSKESLVKDNISIFSGGDNKGEYKLRNEIAKYLYHSRGIKAKAENIILASGMQYLLILLNILLKKDAIAIENPSYKQWTQLFDSLGVMVNPIDIDVDGMKVKNLYDTKADLAMITPNHHYPMGTVMPIYRRNEALEWLSQKEDRYIIEDDYDSEFRYKGRPIPAMASLDTEGKIIYLGTFSRAVASSIRLSFMLLPDKLLKKYEEKLDFIVCSVPRIDQDILYRFMSEGYFERHLNRMRFSYKNKHDLIISIFKKYNKFFDIKGDNSGAHLLVQAKFNISEKEMVERAKTNKIKVYPISDYFVDKSLCNINSTVMLGFAAIEKESLEKACHLLLEIWLNEENNVS